MGDVEKDASLVYVAPFVKLLANSERLELLEFFQKRLPDVTI